MYNNVQQNGHYRGIMSVICAKMYNEPLIQDKINELTVCHVDDLLLAFVNIDIGSSAAVLMGQAF